MFEKVDNDIVSASVIVTNIPDRAIIKSIFLNIPKISIDFFEFAGTKY